MTKRLTLITVAMLATPAIALAATGPLATHRGTVRHPLIHRRVAEVHAVRPARPMFFSSTLRVPYRVYEQEGLTRNPSDCVVYGCIGNN